MRKSFGGFALLLICIGVGMILVATYQVMKAPDILEYVTLADQNSVENNFSGNEDQNSDIEEGQSLLEEDKTEKKKTATALKQMVSSLEEESAELSKVASVYTWWGFASGVTVSEKEQIQNTAEVSLKALGAGYMRVYSLSPLNGRLFYEDELKYGDPVALIDEQLALKMFQATDPIDRELVIQEKTYRIVGIVRHKKGVGDAAEYGVYLPMMTLANEGGQQLDQFILAAIPEHKAGTLQAMEDIAKRWRPKGTLHDTRKEKEMALLVPRWVSGTMGIYALVWLAKALQWLGKRWMIALKAKLRESYMVRLTPWVVAHGVALLGGFGIWIGMAYLLCTYMMRPVLLHPEWVPVIPVEAEEIAKTFWNLQWMYNTAMELRTPNMLRLRHFGTLASAGTLTAMLGMIGALVNKSLKTLLPRNIASEFDD